MFWSYRNSVVEQLFRKPNTFVRELVLKYVGGLTIPGFAPILHPEVSQSTLVLVSISLPAPKLTGMGNGVKES